MKSIIYIIHEPFLEKIKKFNESIKTVPNNWDIYITTSGVVDVKDHKQNLDKIIKRDYHHMVVNDKNNVDHFNKNNMIFETIKNIKTENFVLVSEIVDFSNFEDSIIEEESYIALIKTRDDLVLKNLDVIFTNKKTWEKYYEEYEGTNVYDKLNFIFNYMKDEKILYFYKNQELSVLEENSFYGFSFDSFLRFNKKDLIQKSCCLSNNYNINIFYNYKEII